jgi:hypothetical protein
MTDEGTIVAARLTPDTLLSYLCSSAFIYNQMLNFKFSILNCGTFLI